MKDSATAARDISYSFSATTRSGRALIRVMENTTGRLGLIKRARGYELDLANGQDFWDVMVARYGLSLNIIGGALSNIPKTGPLILVANHPYGILDGLMMGHILRQTRGDFRILANSVFSRSEALERVILPISFEETKDAMRLNLETRREALQYLGEGGAIGIFPGGTVSTAASPFTTPLDPSWRNFTARMVAKSDATVVPVFFEGTNSRLFQIASHLHTTLRMGLLIKEFKNRIDSPVDVVIGDPIAPDQLRKRAADSKAMMDFLRQSTYELSPRPLANCGYGHEFEEKHRA
ncbi:lysophospholipid acyltransferase family protein [Lentibacter sp.]|uniref:lysophospholipid acyltransferase family protein n=1 Tax=Lentibacter sp. TaxID=2024994 RepID=UPI003F6D9B99